MTRTNLTRNAIATAALLLVTLGNSPVRAAEIQAAAAVRPAKESTLTLGAIQRLIRNGMSSAEVHDVAGSPNLVTRNRAGLESWVYDRFATEMSEEGWQLGGGGLGTASGGSSGILGVLGGSAGKKKSSTTQRTLMLVVTFDKDGLVQSFTYRSSKF
jgi:hypothetical protein